MLQLLPKPGEDRLKVGAEGGGGHGDSHGFFHKLGTQRCRHMQRLSPGQRAGGDRGEHIAGAVLAAGNLSGPIGEQTATEHTGPAGIANITRLS